MNSATWHSKELLDMTPKKVDFANRRLLPPAFSLRTFGALWPHGRTGKETMDQPPSARKEARCERMNSSEHLRGAGSAGLSGDTLIPTGRDISHLTSSQESFAGGSRHLLNHHWLNHNVITSACEGGARSNCQATGIDLEGVF
jgi:hypothetical protein